MLSSGPYIQLLIAICNCSIAVSIVSNNLQTIVYITEIDSPHLEIWLLDQGDKLVVFFVAQG